MKRRAILALVLVLPTVIAAQFMRSRKRAAGAHPHWTAIMGGTSTQPTELSSGFATAVMGGVELDLRQATLAATPATLNVAVFWGGMLVRVPDDWQVTLDLHPTMGGVRDFREEAPPREAPRSSREALRSSTEAPDLVINGSVLMGGFVLAGDIELDEIGERMKPRG
jgi:hypothetical protein